MAEHWTQIPLLKYSPGRVLYYKKKNVIEIGDPQPAYSPCKLQLVAMETREREKILPKQMKWGLL